MKVAYEHDLAGHVELAQKLANRKLSGDVNGLSGGTIFGWAWDSLNPDCAISLKISTDTGFSANVIANEFRDDLVSFGGGNHAFFFKVPSQWYASGPVTITVVFAETDIMLPRGEIVLGASAVRTNSGPAADSVEGPDCSSQPATRAAEVAALASAAPASSAANARFRGDVNGLKSGYIRGWAWDPHNPNDVVALTISTDADNSSVALANHYREDLQNFGNGEHAFKFKVPKEWYSSLPVTVTVAFAATGEILPRGTLVLQPENRSEDRLIRTSKSARSRGNPEQPSIKFWTVGSSLLQKSCRHPERLSPLEYMMETRSVRTWLKLSERVVGGADSVNLLWVLASSIAWGDRKLIEHALGLTGGIEDNPNVAGDPRLVILKAEAHAAIGEAALAQRTLMQGASLLPEVPDFWFGLARLVSRDDRPTVEEPAWDKYRHKLLERGLSLLGADQTFPLAAQPPSISNTGAPDTGLARAQHTRVTILCPMRGTDPARLRTIRSILNQTETSLEVLVTSSSCDGDLAVALSQLSARDPRLVLLDIKFDDLFPAALNALEPFARGIYVVAAYPDQHWDSKKLERHLDALTRNPHARGSVGLELALTAEGQPLRSMAASSYCTRDTRSILIERRLLQELGGWIEIIHGSEEALLYRIEEKDVLTSEPTQSCSPLTLTWPESSLTIDISEQGVISPSNWAISALSELRGVLVDSTVPEIAKSPRLAPLTATPSRTGSVRPRHFDVILASNFTMGGGSVQSSAEEIIAQHRAGLHTGLVQLRNVNSADGLGARRNPVDIISHLLNAGAAERILPGEPVRCDLLLIRYPPVLDWINPILPNISARKIRVIMNQPPRRTFDSAEFYDIKACHSGLAEMVGTGGLWCPIGPGARAGCQEYLDFIPFAETDWHNVIDVKEWPCREDVFVGSVPVIGRHARDDETKWPETAADLRAAYVAGSPEIEVRILGGAERARHLLGHFPENWTVYPYGSMSAQVFLRELDIFVFFPHSQRIEAFGRTIIEAMAIGTPVILPKAFEPTFGSAALYGSPTEVSDIVQWLYKNPDEYLNRRRIARCVVEERFSHTEHIRRVSELLEKH